MTRLDRFVAAAFSRSGDRFRTRRPSAELVRDLNDYARRIGGPPVRCPRRPGAPAMASEVGPTRADNQDYALAFRVGRHFDVLLVADGVGGSPLGAEASYLAVATASRWLARALAHRKPMVPVLRQAFAAARSRLAREGVARGITTLEGGLRTTLLAAVIDRRANAVIIGWIGDGAIWHASGETSESLIAAHRDPSGGITRSLGPTLHGEPEFRALPWQAGDLLVLACDGVEEVVPADFPFDVLDAAQAFKGNLRATAAAIIDEIGGAADEFGFIARDNLSLALCGDCAAFTDAAKRAAPLSPPVPTIAAVATS